MKSKRNLIQICLLCAAMLPAVVQAQFIFTTNSDGSLNIYQYTGSGGVVVIPNTTNGLPITSIEEGAFYVCSTLTSVTIGTNVTSIGDDAFDECINMTNLIIGNAVTNIGNSAFPLCYSLTSVLIPNSVISIGYGAFNGCQSLTNVTIGSGVTSIGNAAFYGSYMLKAITVDSNNPAYSSLSGVLFDKSQTTLIQFAGGMNGSYTIPNSVTDILVSAFGFCSLTNITIPDGVTCIGSGTFYPCYSLTAITVDSNNSAYSSLSGVLFDKSQTTILICPQGKAGSYTVPNIITNIGYEAFYDCARLTSVTIGNSVTYIGYYSFQNCTGLTNVTIGNSVTSIGTNAFFSCTGLKSITIPNSVTNIGYYAFANCTSLTSITIPNSVINIGYCAFQNCTSLTSITIPSSVKWFGAGPFCYCTNLTSVYFQGDAPIYSIYPFYSDSKATIYYMPGTSGWYTTYDSTQTKLWNPQVQTSDANFGVQSNRFGFTITGSSNLVIVVESCTNVASPVWLPLSTNTLKTFIGTNGTFYFSDPQWTNYPGRFYRLRSP
jgi:hypothetical protein